MRFYAGDSEYVELRRSGNGDLPVLLEAAHVRDGAKLWVQNFNVLPAELKELADWLENFWDPCPPAKLGGVLEFSYSHREHIGEGYYYIKAAGTNLLLAYEQLGESNVARAKEVRALVSE